MAGNPFGVSESPDGRWAFAALTCAGEVAVTPDDRLAVISLEGRGALAVYNLRRALTRGFGPADFAGLIPVGVTPDGRTLLVGNFASQQLQTVDLTSLP